MSIPLFYIEKYDDHRRDIVLDEETSRHVVQVLRKQPGERINLTDGLGHLLETTISGAHKKHCEVRVESRILQQRKPRQVTMAVSLLKNASRYEWLLEKCTEIGVSEIVPLLCMRTEKDKFRFDRMKGIVVSAMLQSQQTWLPILHQPLDYNLLFRQEEVASVTNRFIAHCITDDLRLELNAIPSFDPSSIILIGPEGDFTTDEVRLATDAGFQAISLGTTRLRTETAAVAAAIFAVMR